MKKVLVLALVGLFAFGFTGCNKEEDTPEPQPVATTQVVTPPPATTATYIYQAYGNNWGNSVVVLNIYDASNNLLHSAQTTSNNSITLNLDETYNYSISATNIGSCTGEITIGTSTFSQVQNTNTGLSVSFVKYETGIHAGKVTIIRN